MHSHRRTACRLCGNARLACVLSLTPTPPANALVPASALEERQDTYPLDVHLCGDCGHLQLLDVIDARVLFENYLYVSGTSSIMVAHLRDYAARVIERLSLKPGDLVVEIGSNDGTLLGFFQRAGMRVLGVDPAREIAMQATESGIETLADFFTPALAARIRESHGPATAICANNVFAHIDDLKGVIRGVRNLLAPDGLFIFEVSYLLDVYEKRLFDTIYHEHLDYHRVEPLRRFFRENGMAFVDAQRVSMQGGSLRGFAKVANGSGEVGAAVDELQALERAAGLANPETFRRFAAQIDRRRVELTALLKCLKADGKTVAGYGAAAKSTTLMNQFGLGRDFIEFIVDDNPLKQGLYSPGLHVPVLPANALYERRPDYVVVLAWNFAEEIIAAHVAFTQAGGRFVIPLPDLTIR
jgi:SAM-dependent methyltransferase